MNATTFTTGCDVLVVEPRLPEPGRRMPDVLVGTADPPGRLYKKISAEVATFFWGRTA